MGLGCTFGVVAFVHAYILVVIFVVFHVENVVLFIYGNHENFIFSSIYSHSSSHLCGFSC